MPSALLPIKEASIFEVLKCTKQVNRCNVTKKKDESNGGISEKKQEVC